MDKKNMTRREKGKKEKREVNNTCRKCEENVNKK